MEQQPPFLRGCLDFWGRVRWGSERRWYKKRSALKRKMPNSWTSWKETWVIVQYSSHSCVLVKHLPVTEKSCGPGPKSLKPAIHPWITMDHGDLIARRKALCQKRLRSSCPSELRYGLRSELMMALEPELQKMNGKITRNVAVFSRGMWSFRWF